MCKRECVNGGCPEQEKVFLCIKISKCTLAGIEEMVKDDPEDSIDSFVEFAVRLLISDLRELRENL